MNKTIIYYNIYNGSIYDALGNLYGNRNFSVFLDNNVILEMHYVTDENEGDPSTWPKWTGLSGLPIASSVAVDNNVQHAIKGSLAEALSIGAITQVKATLSGTPFVNPTGTIQLIDASGNKTAIDYTALTIADSVYTFTVSTTLTESFALGTTVRVPEALMIKAEGEDIDDSLFAQGIFTINLYAMSYKLLELLDYSDTASISSTMQHKILSEGEVINTYDMNFYIKNLLDFDNDAVVPNPDTSTQASKAWVLSLIRSGIEFQFSTDGVEWHATQSLNDAYFHFRYIGAGGTWSDPVALPIGEVPYIGDNGNWYVGTTDTGVKANGGVYINVLEVPFTTTSGTGETVTITSAQLGAEGTPELELIDSNGYNLTSDSRLTRRWTVSGYEMTWLGGWPVGTFKVKPQGAKGTTGDSINTNPILSGNTILDSTWGRCAYLDSTYTSMEFFETQYNVAKVRLQVVSANPAVTGNIIIVPRINGVDGTSITVAVGATYSFVDLPITPVNGTLVLRRDYNNVADTLRDVTPVTAIILNWMIYYVG